MPQDTMSSLSLLLPPHVRAAWAREPTIGPSPSSSDTSTPDPIDDYTAAELIRISRSFEDTMRAGTPSALSTLTEKHIHPNFTARFDTAFISSWKEYCSIMMRWIEANPGYQKTITAATADVSEDGREAEVYFLMELTGWPVELKRMVVSVLKWKKRKGRWVCFENSTMRGVDTFDTAATGG